MDFTKDILDFTLKVERGEMDLGESTKPMMPEANDFNMFSEPSNCPEQQQVEEQQAQATQSETNDKTNTKTTTTNETETTTATTTMKTPPEVMAKPTTPQLIESVATQESSVKPTMSGDISPPPRPLTSSEVVGFTNAIEDPEMQLDATVALNKSRSLPASPNHLAPTHLGELFGFAAMKSLDAPTTKIPDTLEERLLTNLIPKVLPKAASKALPEPGRNNQQFCLRWNNYQSNLTNVFDELLQNESFVDVTLACEGHSIKAHKMILSACSPYFQALFYDNPCQHPIVIMRDVRWQELKALMEFMYKGEINVSQDQINPLLKVAEMLKIRGLAEVSSTQGTGSQLLPGHRPMYQEDEEEEEEQGDDEGNNNDDQDASPNAKRRKIQVSQRMATAPVEEVMNMAEQRMRKRSRDGFFVQDGRMTPKSPGNNNNNNNTRNLGDLSGPQLKDKESCGFSSPANPGSITTSTIVRNPFASPNPLGTTTPMENTTALNASSSSSSSSCIEGAGSASGSHLNSAQTASPSIAASSNTNPVALQYRPSGERSCSPPLMTPTHVGSRSASVGGNTATPSSLPSPSSNSSGPPPPPPISIHPHPAAAAVAAAALANPHHPHHHAAAAAQQLAAQHQQLQAAAHSHAMASALGASLAAAAAGASTTASNPAGASSSHHDDMEIKPEIAEMIREEERVSLERNKIFLKLSMNCQFNCYTTFNYLRQLANLFKSQRLNNI
uniref:BTB domain-containing protein n=1 Tax=Musca domestica TaxID=7370 RepID=A0A1I8MZ76_MUSDO